MDDPSATCLTCGAQLLDTDHQDWCENRVRVRPGAADAFGRIELSSIVRGDATPLQPSMFQRDDGQGLLYVGGRHDVHGPPGSGKSMTAAEAAREELEARGRVAVFDYESTGMMFVERMRALGAPDDVLADPDRVMYLNPVKLSSQDVETLAQVLADWGVKLIIVDAVGPAMARQGLDENANPDIAKWHADFVEPVRGDATALLVDHVSRDAASRTRGSRGGWMKLQLLDVSYGVRSFKSFSRTKEGMLRLVCAKDRFGTYAVNEHVADVEVTPCDGRVDVTVRAPATQDEAGPWKPTGLMQKLSIELERRQAAEEPDPDRGQTLDLIAGRAAYKRQALDALIDGGHVKAYPDGRHVRHHVIKPYREQDDEGPDDAPKEAST